jgi:transaldolase
MSTCLQELTNLGVSIWLDDLSRERLVTGNLAQLVETSCVRGVTTNPAIFQKAISEKADAYSADLSRLTADGCDVDQVIRTLTTDDVRSACDLLIGVFDSSFGVDGRVSIEVDPRLAHDTEATVKQAAELWELVGRRNALIKIPATKAGLPAITATIGAGISVNVTLIFSVERYREVVDAYLAGLDIARASGIDLSGIHSVASFFVSRVDTEIDKRLNALGTDVAHSLRGKAGLANARLAWSAHEDVLATRRWADISALGALPQRPLWASTGVKDPSYDDTMYVVDLAVNGCVNTMPEPTLDAVRDHGVFRGDTVTGTAMASREELTQLAGLGIDITEVCDLLENEGVQKFIDSWESLRATVSTAMATG